MILALHKEVFRSFGYETVILHPPLDEKDYETINDGAFLWTLMNHKFLDDTISRNVNIPIITAINGYGKSSMLPDAGPMRNFCKVTKHADLVTCLDLNAYEEFINSSQRFEYDKIVYLPNAKNSIDVVPKRAEPFIIGCLLKEVPRTREQRYYLEATNIVGKTYPELTFSFPIFWWHRFDLKYYEAKYPYVAFHPLVPYAELPQYLGNCDIFTHYSSFDAFSKVITEASSVKKAPIVSDQVRTQGIHRKYLPIIKDAIGKPLDKAYSQLKPLLFTGNLHHLLIVPKRDPEACAKTILWAHDHMKTYAQIGEEAKLWVDEWYTWREKWEVTFKLMEEKGLT